MAQEKAIAEIWDDPADATARKSEFRVPEVSEKTRNPTRIIRCGKCLSCQCYGYCEQAQMPRITDAMLNDRHWLRDARNFASSLSIGAALWPAEIFILWRDLKVIAPDDFPIVELFSPPDDADGEEIRRFTEALRTWCRDFLNMAPLPASATVYVTKDRREHARIVFALLASHHPEAFMRWGKR